jgi:hypothetical protein
MIAHLPKRFSFDRALSALGAKAPSHSCKLGNTRLTQSLSGGSRGEAP